VQKIDDEGYYPEAVMRAYGRAGGYACHLPNETPIVAAEMLVGGAGIGYFVWSEWNNLSISSVVTAILWIGVVGMLLDLILARLTRLVTFPE
jgi:hypothetical protein